MGRRDCSRPFVFLVHDVAPTPTIPPRDPSSMATSIVTSFSGAVEFVGLMEEGIGVPPFGSFQVRELA